MRINMSASVAYKGRPNAAQSEGHRMLDDLTRAMDRVMRKHGYQPNRVDPNTLEGNDHLGVEIRYP